MIKYSMDELKNKSSIHSCYGKSVIGGCNTEGYPKHHFEYRVPLIGTLPLSVCVAGRDEWKHGAFRYRINSDTFAIELVEEGEFLIESDHLRYSVSAGTLFFVQRHRDSAMMCTTPYAVKQTAILSGQLLESLLDALSLDTCVILSPRNLPLIREELCRLHALLTEKSVEAHHQADVTAYSLLLHLAEEKRISHPPAMQNLLDFIHAHLDTMLTVSDLAQTSGLGVATIHRMFLAHCHCSPLVYMTGCRMKVAEQMLSGGEHSIKEIAAILGYRNQLYFSTAFKKFHGLSPSAYRLKHIPTSTP